MTGKEPPLAVQTWDALKGAFWPIFQDIGEQTREAGATPAQISLLFILFTAPGPMTPLAAARVLGVTPGTVTGVLNPLEAMGLLERSRGESADRRVVHLRLTPKGREVLKAWIASCRAILETRMAPLSEAEQRALIALLARVGPPDPGVPAGLASALRSSTSPRRKPGKPSRRANRGGKRATDR